MLLCKGTCSLHGYHYMGTVLKSTASLYTTVSFLLGTGMWSPTILATFCNENDPMFVRLFIEGLAPPTTQGHPRGFHKFQSYKVA